MMRSTVPIASGLCLALLLVTQLAGAVGAGATPIMRSLQTPGDPAVALPIPHMTLLVNGDARNDGENNADLPREGGGSTNVTYDHGRVLISSDAQGSLDGVEAYVGFLTGGLHGSAGLWGSLVLGNSGCAWQTWGSSIAAAGQSAPRAECRLDVVTP